MKIQDLQNFEIVSGGLQQPEQPKQDFSLEETLLNIPSSAGRFIGDIYSAVRHPLQTVQGLADIVSGGLEKGIVSGVEAVKPGTFPGKPTEREEKFNAVIDFFVQRYGSMDKIKKTVQEDPVGFLGDVSLALTGGGAVLKGAGTVSKIQKVAQAGKTIQVAGLAIEPLTLIGKGAYITTYPIRKVGGTLARESLGVTTGAGGEVIKEAFRNPTPEFTQALRGQTSVENILTGAREGLHTLREQRATAYRTALEGIKESKKVIDIKPFKRSIDDKLKKFGIKVDPNGNLDFSKSVIADRAEAVRISQFIEELRRWNDATPAGLDILKQRLDDFYTPSGRGTALTTEISSELKQILRKEIPGYTEMTKGYAEASEVIKEIERTLSLKPGAAVDTTLRKLMSTLRQNNEFRRTLVNKLDELTEKNITSQIAGASLAPGVPSGLIGRSVFAGSLGL